MQYRLFLAAALILIPILPAAAAGINLEVTVNGGPHDRLNAPAQVAVAVPESLARSPSVLLRAPDGTQIVGQLTAPGLLAKPAPVPAGSVARELHFIVPKLAAGQKLVLQAAIGDSAPPAAASFRWHDTPGDFTELRHGARPVLRYMYKAIDESTPKARELTFKVYHHVFDPTGKQLVTKGPGGLYTHHRGVFYGFNRVTYDSQKVDIWHCTGDTHQSHQGILSQDEGPVVGRHCVAINWHGVGKKVFAKEERELTAWSQPGGTLIAFASRLRSTAEKVRLDGDPQHAGFHFRASNEVADTTAKQTYYLRPDGKGKMGETRNWEPKTRKGPVNLPWNAMSFVVGGQRYTVTYLDNPNNPKEARFSERDYGRFGSYFEYDLTPSSPLDVSYRLWLQEGEMTVAQVAAESANFVEPVQVSVK